MAKDTKLIRGQVRQVVKEILPEIIKEELFMLIEKNAQERLAQLAKEVRAQMHEMNERHKDTMGYLVRQVSSPIKKD